jgi:O-antigen/teichoic acid export membrane protein
VPSWKEISSIAVRFSQHGKWAIFEDFLANSGKNIQPFIVKNLVSTEAVAILAVAQNLYSYIVPLFPIRDVLSPVFPRVVDDPNHLVSQIKRASKYAVLSHIIIGVFAAAISPILVKLFFPKYVLSIPLFYILLLNLPWLGFRSVLLPAFYATRAQKILFKITIFRILLTVILSIVLTYAFGIWGAAIGLMLVGVLITKPMIRSLKIIHPLWTFSLRDLWSFDHYDYELLRKIKNKLKNK